MMRFILVFSLVALLLGVFLVAASAIVKAMVAFPIEGGLGDLLRSLAGSLIFLVVAVAMAGIVGVFIYVRNR